MKDRETKPLTFDQSIQVGAAAGVAQSVFSLPFWTMKVRTQCNYKTTLDPRVLYKGFYPATAAIVLTSTSQVVFSSGLHQIIRANFENTSESSERILAAIGSGPLSAFFANPVGIVITQQHKYPKRKFLEIATSIRKECGLRRFYVSYPGNTAVNSIFTLGFYGIYPALESKYSPPVACGVLGLFNSLLSQGIDTAKTIQEEQAGTKKTTLKEAYKLVKDTQGFRALYKGFFFNTLAGASATLCAGIAIEKAENYFKKK